MNDKITVGIADMKMAKGSGVLITYGTSLPEFLSVIFLVYYIFHASHPFL